MLFPCFTLHLCIVCWFDLITRTTIFSLLFCSFVSLLAVSICIKRFKLMIRALKIKECIYVLSIFFSMYVVDGQIHNKWICKLFWSFVTLHKVHIGNIAFALSISVPLRVFKIWNLLFSCVCFSLNKYTWDWTQGNQIIEFEKISLYRKRNHLTILICLYIV